MMGATIHGRKSRNAAIIAAMDEVNKHRALTDAEVSRLWKAIKNQRHQQRVMERRRQSIGLAISDHEADKRRAGR